MLKLMDQARDRRADLDPLQLGFGRQPPLLQIGDLLGGFAQIARDLVQRLLADLSDLHVNLADAASGTGDLRFDVASLSLELRERKPLRIDARELRQALLEQRFQPGELIANHRRLTFDRLLLRGQTFDLLVDLVDPLAQLRHLAVARALARVEQLILDVDGAGGVLIDPTFGGRGRKFDGRLVVAFGGKPRRANLLPIKLHHHHAELGARLGFVHPHQEIAGGDLLSVAHEDRRDAAAVLMLNATDIALDHHVARRDHRTADFDQRRVADDAEEEDRRDDVTREQPAFQSAADVCVLRIDRRGPWMVRIAHDLAVMPPERPAISGLTTTRLSTSSRGPNVDCVPSRTNST